MSSGEMGKGLSTGAMYHVYDVPAQGAAKPTQEIHAYEQEDWGKLGLLTRMVARFFGRVTDSSSVRR